MRSSNLLSNQFLKNLFGVYKEVKGINGLLRNFFFLPFMDAIIGFSILFTSLTLIKILGWAVNIFETVTVSTSDLIYSFSAFVLLFVIRLLINLTYRIKPKN